MVRVVLLPVALLLAFGAQPVAGQTDGVDWCAGLIRYLDEQTRLSFGDEAGAIARDGCIAYLAAADPPSTGAQAPDVPAVGSFQAFADRALAAMTEVQGVSGVSIGSGLSFEDEARSFEALGEWARTERRWLQDNPPEACWADLQRRWADGIADIEAGAMAMAAGIRERDLSKVSGASDMLLGTVDRLDELQDEMEALDC